MAQILNHAGKEKQMCACVFTHVKEWTRTRGFQKTQETLNIRAIADCHREKGPPLANSYWKE